MSRKNIAAAILAAAVSFLCGGCQEVQRPQAEPQTENYPELVVVYPGEAADKDLIQEKVSEITREKLGINVRLEILPDTNYQTRVNRMLSSQEQVDLMYAYQSLVQENFMQGRLADLSELIQEYGQGIIREVGEENIETCRINGKLYGVPNNRDYAEGWDSYAISAELMDKYGISKEDIQTYEDLEQVFAYIHKQEPDIYIVDTGSGTMGNNQQILGGIGGAPFGVMMGKEEDEEFVNVFETEEYMNFLKRVRSWYLKGYMTKNVITEQETFAQKMKSGRLFAYTTVYKPGIEEQERVLVGKDIYVVQLGKTMITSNQKAGIQWCITGNTVSREKAMELMNLLYTDRDIMNLMAYGIEGIHYEKTQDGYLTYAKERDRYYFAGRTWMMPNSFILDVWEGNPKNLWEEFRVFNSTADDTCDQGFNFDITNVYGEYVKLREVYEKYRMILENGMVDPEYGCMKLNEELKNNGLEEVIKEKNRQFQRWKRETKKQTQE